MRERCAPGPESVPLEPNEAEIVKQMTQTYYRENWSKFILRYLRYANPNIAQS